MRATLAHLLSDGVTRLSALTRAPFNMAAYTEFVDAYPAQIVTLCEQARRSPPCAPWSDRVWRTGCLDRGCGAGVCAADHRPARRAVAAAGARCPHRDRT
jgi:hypothetical protein